MEIVGGSTMVITIILVVAGLAAVVYVLVSRVRGQPLNQRRVIVLPAVITAVGVLELVRVAQHAAPPVDLSLLTAGIAVSLAMGVARGMTVLVSEHDGQPWMRYERLTLLLWLGTIVLRGGLSVAGREIHAPLAAGGPALLVGVGVTLLTEGAVVARRATLAHAGGVGLGL